MNEQINTDSVTANARLSGQHTRTDGDPVVSRHVVRLLDDRHAAMLVLVPGAAPPSHRLGVVLTWLELGDVGLEVGGEGPVRLFPGRRYLIEAAVLAADTFVADE